MVLNVSFANLGALLWLIPLAGVIILLYLLRMRRKDLRVPATFLWPAMTYEIRANALFQKLKFSWLMVLQLLALTLIVFAIARPQFRQRGLGGEVTVIVIDTSASMSATDVKPSRFGEAQRIARSIIDSARTGDRISLIEAGPTPRVVFPLSSDVPRMRRALDEIKPTDADAEVGEALRLAASLTAKQEAARIVLLSDGVFPDVTNFSPGKAEMVFNKIGKSGDNVAVTALGMADTSSGRQLYCGLKNFGGSPAAGILMLYADGKMFDSMRVELKANGSVGENVHAPGGAKVLEAKLDLNDSLAADNYAVTLADPGASIRVLLVTRGNLFLERALALDPRVTLDKSATVPSTGEWDVVFFDGIPEEPVRAKSVVCFGRAGDSSPVVAEGTLNKPEMIATDAQNPVLKAVGFDTIFVDQAERVKPKPEAETIAQFKGGAPLVVISHTGGQSHVYLAFEPLQSDFPLQVGFPIFVANILDFAIPPATRGAALAVNAGKPFAVPAPKDEPITLEGPQVKTTINAIAGNYLVRDIRTVGTYSLNGRKVFASLRSDIESNVLPNDKVVLGGKMAASSGSVLRLADLWRPLLLLALMVLAGEWWLFARRS